MTFSDALLALSPVAYYRMGEASGTTLVDSSGNSHDGSYVGGVTLGAPGLVSDADTAVALDGTGAATVPYGAEMDAAVFSAVVVVNVDAITGLQYAWARPDVFELYVTDSGTAAAYVYTDTPGSAFAAGGTVAAGAPVLLGVTFDGTTIRLYVGADEVATTALTGVPAVTAGGFSIGGYDGVAGFSTTGVLDEAAWFDSVLTAGDFAALAAFVAAPELPAHVSDLTFAGYGYGGASVATYNPPVAEPAPGAPAPKRIGRSHHNPGVPTFEAGTGRPLFGAFNMATDVTDNDWCDYIRVTVDGRDVTFFRDGGDEQSRTQVKSWQHLDPYGDGPAELSFPQVTEFDNPGEGDLAWLRPTARVVLNRVIDGAVVDRSDPLWVGIITRDGLESGPLSVTCEGAYMGRESRLLHQPYFLHNPARLLKDHLIREHRKIYRADFQIVGSVTGPLLRQRGTRSDTRLTYVDSLLGLSNREDGGSYTLLPDRSVARNAMRLQLRQIKTTPDYTIHAGAHGVKVSLAREVSTNRVQGEGVNKDGGRWGNRVFPFAGYDDDPPDYPFAGDVGMGTTGFDPDAMRTLTRRLWSLGLLNSDDAGSAVFDEDVEDAINEFRRNLKLPETGTMTATLWPKLYRQGFNKQTFQGAHFEPLAAATETVRWLRGPGGLVTEPNDGYDRGVMPVEEFMAFGENVSKREGKKYARATIARQPQRVGTITLTSDPAECSRFDMRGGTTLLVKNLLGSGATGVKLYVSSVEIDWAGGSVSLAVSTTALHFVELQTIRQRQVEARQNPSKRARRALRQSGITKDVVQGWESEGPSGVIPRRMATGGKWNPSQVVACEYGNLAELRIVADNPTPIWSLWFDRPVPASLVDHVIGNPAVWRNVSPGRTLTDAVTTDGDATVTSASGAFTDSDIGRTISGPGIPSGATITGRNSSTSIDVSPAPTATASGVNVDIGPNGKNRKNTFDVHAEFLHKHGLVQAYGSPEEPGGYWPHRHTNDEGNVTDWPVSGVLFDDSPQAFVTTAGFLWVYNYVMSDSIVHGRAKLIPES